MRAPFLPSRDWGVRHEPDERPRSDGSLLEKQVLELWFGGFDTSVIADSLRANGLEITEADAANIVAREMDRRHAACTAPLTSGTQP